MTSVSSQAFATTEDHDWQELASVLQEYDNNFPATKPVLNVTVGNETGRFAWEAPAWIHAYLLLSEIQGSPNFLEQALQVAEHIAANNDANRFKRGEIDIVSQPYWQAPKYYLNNAGVAAPGWRGKRKGDSWRVEALTDGIIAAVLLMVVDHVYRFELKPYYQRADALLDLAETVVDSHSSSYSETKQQGIGASFYYPNVHNRYSTDKGLYSPPLANNHNLVMAKAMLLIHKWRPTRTDLWQKAAKLNEFFLSQIDYDSSGSCQWNYAYKIKGWPKVQDITHADIEIGFLLLAHERGIDSVTPALACMANTLVDVMYHKEQLSFKVDGSGEAKYYHQYYVANHWLQLAQCRPEILTIAHTVLTEHSDKPLNFNSFLGYVQLFLASRDRFSKPFDCPIN
ncbi:hypothetical protein [Paraferrimonas haliotis]|uniref:Uncharacterized protein n=1 Tax=Paraferrimonas haliotis TaxID=2013866 RepID=A0AA37X075_9GAMM|nr:hypothetical protein [Paraferrimonas haliotis]GLS84591.1 hypothetical protein GCM10007894_25680 [Paraferrimonas haliotis]